jgi:hypothetical protein
MTPQQRECLISWANRGNWQVDIAIRAALAKIDAQEAELATLRQLAMLMGQDEAGAVEAGFRRGLEVAAGLLQRRLLMWQAAWTEDAPQSVDGRIDELEVMRAAIINRGPLLSPLPPEELARQNERLRAALREVIELSDCYEGTASYAIRYRQAIEEARKLLAETHTEG